LEDILWAIIETQQEYIYLVGEEIRKMASSLEAHGYRYDRSKLEECKKFRNTIDTMLEVCKKIKDKK